MDSGRNYKITRAILVMTAILMSVVLGSIGVSHNQNPSTEQQPETIAKLSKQPANGVHSQPDKQPQSITANIPSTQPKAQKLTEAVIHKSGAIAQDEVWTSEDTYVADEPVIVPEGKKLTITPGTVVKGTDANDVIIVEAGGTLSIEGVRDNPVVITSSKDNTVGSDTNDGDSLVPPQAGDYGSAVRAGTGGEVAIKNVHVSYASTAFSLENNANITDTQISFSQTALRITGGEPKLTGISIDFVDIGLAVSNGVVDFQGSMTNVAHKNIQACNWGVQGCAVSATYTNVSAEVLGTLSACGQVTLASSLSSLIGGLLKTANCEAIPAAEMLNPTV